MGFEPGHKKIGGRTKGVKNQKTLLFEETLSKHNFNPLEAMLWVFETSKSEYIYFREQLESGRFSPMEDQSSKYMSICASMAKEISSYLYSKPKSVEIKMSDSDGFKVILEDYTTKKKND